MNFLCWVSYEINGLENFIACYATAWKIIKSTMHQDDEYPRRVWEEDLYKGETYCIASHFFDEDNKPHKLDMGIIYSDVIEVRDGTAKFLSRDFFSQMAKNRCFGYS